MTQPPYSARCGHWQHLEPLPELPEHAEDRFFNKDFDFQYPAGPTETIFPSWGAGSSSTDLSSLAAGPASGTQPPTASSAVPSQPVNPSGCTLLGLPSAFGVKRTALEPQGPQQTRLPSAGPDRHVFLRQRLGGESSSSGNSSTSTSSDTGSASDDNAITGEWEHSGGDDEGAATIAMTEADSPAGAAAGKGARKKRQTGGSRAGGRCRKSSKRERRARDAGGMRDGCGKVAAGGRGAYRPWDGLVRSFRQRIEQPDSLLMGNPSAGRGDGANAWGSPYKLVLCSTDGICTAFSGEPRPDDPRVFSVEQCSACGHPTAVASYLLRIRCAGGSHIVRRTWDDIASLCDMLRRGSFAAGGELMGSEARSLAASIAGVEFAPGPADVLGPHALPSFLHALLSRPGVASLLTVRRFLELEFLDGTLRGGASDCGRERAAGEVARIAAAAAAAAPGLAPGFMPGGPPEMDGAINLAVGVAQGAEASPAAACAAVASASSGVPIPGYVRPGLARQTSLLGPCMAGSALPAHPDAARDLAAVCRSLGELGAAAFTGMPRTASTAYWAPREASGGSDGRASGNLMHRGMAVLG